MPEKPTERNAPRIVKLLVLVHLFCIMVWAIPMAKDSQFTGDAKPPVFDIGDWIRLYNQRYLRGFPPVVAYLFLSGTWQYWDMFAPQPAHTDSWCDAEIIYKDGKKKYYLYPRMYSLPIPNKYAQERYRKFFERAGDSDYKSVWPQFALRIAYLNDNPANPPWTVRLYRHALDIAPPGQKQATEYSSQMFFEYAVRQDMLQRMRTMPG